MAGEWHSENGCLIGAEHGNKGGILFSKDFYDEDVMLKFKAKTVLPATRDVNAVFCAKWDKETDYLHKDSYVCGLNGWWEGKFGIESNDERFRALTNSYTYIPGKEIEMICGAIKGHTFMVVDGELVTEFIDTQPIIGGHVGFSPYCTMLSIRDAQIYKINWKNLSRATSLNFKRFKEVSVMERRKNPYLGVDFKNTKRFVGCTHMHCEDNGTLHKYLDNGLNFVTISNYYPSAPWYPMADIRENTLKMRQNGYIKNGEYVDKLIDFNALAKSYIDELDGSGKSKLVDDEGELVFKDIPGTILEAPNSEFHSTLSSPVEAHFTCPGSNVSSCTFDRDGKLLLQKKGYGRGFPLEWKKAFDITLNHLITKDGGGIILNHPCWSQLPIEYVYNILDYDERVLGIEVYNHGAETTWQGSSETMWDTILGTGRQCFGFFAQDHMTPDGWKGRMILLPDEPTQAGCLRAYREGRFYGAITGHGLGFNEITFDGKTLVARTNEEARFFVSSKMGLVAGAYGKEISYKLPEGDENKHTFLRVTACQDGIEKIYSQPFILI